MRPKISGRARALAALLLLATTPAMAATAKDVGQYADQLLAKNYPADQPGAAVLIVQDGKEVLRKGYGMADLELGVPVRPDMVFELGSITKQFTATAILLLQERGQLSVQDEITKYLPDFPTQGKKITIENLLTHTSGIPNYTDLPEWIAHVREDLTVDKLIGTFKDKPLEFSPGERWAYDNSGYILLGAIVEKVSGKSYADFVRQEIFTPLGMKHSYYNDPGEVIPGRVEGYDKGEKGYSRAQYLSMTQPYAAGSLMSSVDDLRLWDEALSSGKILRKTSLDAMYTAHKLASGVSAHYGYGWGVSDYEGHPVFQHGGGIFGFTTSILRMPQDRLLVVVLSNNTGAEDNPDSLAFKIAAYAVGKPMESRSSIRLDPKSLDDYVGVYRFDERTRRVITREGDRLFSMRSGGKKTEILATGRDDFFFPEADSRLHFRRDAAGKITGVDFLPRFGPDEIGTRTDEAPAAERQAAKVDPAIYDRYAGKYELAPTFRIAITHEGDQIFAQATGQPKLEIFPSSETEFFLKEVDAQLTFEVGSDGKATGLVLHQNGRDLPGKRVE
jgi:CubicO group peptidase (beta-lactamase class C family)